MDVTLTTLCENTTGGIGYAAEWGLSILVEYAKETVLLDTGLTTSMVQNAITADVDLKQIEKVVISHGHTDHTGGLRDFLKQAKRPVSVYGHPDMWGKKYAAVPAGDGKVAYKYAGIPFCREELEGLGASFVLSKEPEQLNEHMITTGEVPLKTPFEKVDGILYIKTEAGYEPDPLADDQALIIKTDHGLVVVSGCAHRGMINTLRHAREITGVEQIHAVVGGTHLIGADAGQLDQTIAELLSMGIQRLGVSHCTGIPSAMALAGVFQEKFFFNNAGTKTVL